MTVAIKYSMKFKLTKFYLPDYVVPNYVKISSYRDCTRHKYIMEEADSFKRNEKLIKLAGDKMRKRYKLKDIKNAIKLNNNFTAYEEFKATRGTFFKLKDVYNAGAK